MKTSYLSLPMLALLAACGGGGGAGPQSVGSLGGIATAATPSAGGTTSSGGTSTGTASGTGVAAGGLGGTPTSASASSTSTLINPGTTRTYNAVSAVQQYKYNTRDDALGQYAQSYKGNAATVRAPTTTVSYDPRSAIFTLTIKDTPSGIDQTLTFQDPAHRTDFAGSVTPQFGVPNLTTSGVMYLEAGSASGSITGGNNQTPPNGTDKSTYNVATFFYQKPGTSTNYVTFAGYVRNGINWERQTPTGQAAYLETQSTLERGAFVYGDVTSRDQVPTRGTGAYTGAFLATMVNNPTLDDPAPRSTYFQWIGGNSAVNVDFGAATLALSLSGRVGGPFIDRNTTGGSVVPNDAVFTAAGTATIDLPRTGGFTGSFQSAGFTWTTTAGGVTTNNTQTLNVAGSSIDGTFYGPNAVEVGGAFRIVGGTPDQRIDILGAFTGK